MSNGSRAAVENAMMGGDFRFPEFTAKLVNDTFDALISANVRQMESYAELVTQVSKDLSVFINETKDDISGAMILDFLRLLLPSPNEQGTLITKNSTAALTKDEADKLNGSLAVKKSSGESVQGTTFKEGDKVKDIYAQVIDAVCVRLAANKYSMLVEMVNNGVLRLIVESGVLETRLTFRTWGTNSFTETKSEYDRQTKGSVGASSLLSSVFFGPKVSRDSHIIVNATNTKTTSTDSAYYSLFGGVKLNFKTDYITLNK